MNIYEKKGFLRERTFLSSRSVSLYSFEIIGVLSVLSHGSVL